MQEIDIFFLSPTIFFYIFSSPEHNVLGMSYCDQSMSGVRLSVNNCLKNLLLRNRPTDVTEIHRNDSWVMHFQKTSKN